MTQAPSQTVQQSSDAAVNELFEGEASIANHEAQSVRRQLVIGAVAVVAMGAAFFSVVYLVAQVVEALFPLWGYGMFLAFWNR